jgi:pyridoxamine 5'-phosphate oxidase-like protein
VTTWGEFASAAPELAARGEERFGATGLALVGTLRRDGRPRISPVEPLISDGTLYLGMIWQSRKAVDLLRDSRCVVHSTVSDKGGGEGDFKLYGRALPIEDADEREVYCRALEAAIGWRPSGHFHLFAVDVEEVAWVRLGSGTREVLHWSPGAPVQVQVPPAAPA